MSERLASADRSAARAVGRLLVAVVVGSLLAGLPPAIGAATGSSFSIDVATPQLWRNAILAVKVTCPASEPSCHGSTVISTLGNPNAPSAALRQGVLIAPAQPFVLDRGQSTTLRILIPRQDVRLLRQVPEVVFLAYTIAGDLPSRRFGYKLVTADVKLASHDRRLDPLRRVELSFVQARITPRDVVQLTVGCGGASLRARTSVLGACRGFISASAQAVNGNPAKAVSLGAQTFAVGASGFVQVAIPLAHRALARLRQGRAVDVLVYGIAVDPIDKLADAQLLSIRLRSLAGGKRHAQLSGSASPRR